MNKDKKTKVLVLWLLFLPVCSPLLRAGELVFYSAGEVVEFAARNSPLWTIRRQRAALGMEEAKLNIQDFLPTFGFSLSEMDSTSKLAGDSRSKSLRFSLAQEIFNGGKKKLSYQTGRISALYAYQEFLGEWRNFVSSIMSLYYQYLLLQEKTAIREDLLQQGKDQLSILKKEYELGITLETDYLEYSTSYMEIEQERDQALRDLRSMERQFKTALNIREETALRIISQKTAEYEFFFYEPHMEYLWALLKNASIELKKERLNEEYRLKQYEYGRRWYLPVINAQGSVSFTGNHYPLTEPSYSLQLTFDFSQLDFLSMKISNGSGVEKNRLQQISNGVSGDIRPLPAYPLSQKQGELDLLESILGREAGQRELREGLYNAVISHDNTLRAAVNAQQRIVLMERRLEFTHLQLEKGEKKRVDYLAELSSLAQTKIALVDYLTQAAALERNLEIQTNYSFGGLARACKNNNPLR
jgi:outer membrane protein TolC